MKPLANKLKRYLKIYYFLTKFSVLDILIYRINALVMGLAPIIWSVTMLIFLATIFSQVKELGGWNFWEIIFLTGTHEIIFLLTWTTFGPNLAKFIGDVRTGKFDQMLLRPVNTRFLVSFRSLSFSTLGSFINAFFIFFYSFNKLANKIELSRLPGFLLFIAIGYWIAYFVYFIFASLALFFTDSMALFDRVGVVADFGRYPAEIYNSWTRAFLAFFLPILFFAYFPTAFLLGKVGWNYIFLGMVVLFCLYFISHRIWHAGLRRYQSASS